MKKVLIVCLGNICRSPTAEAVLKARAFNTASAVGERQILPKHTISTFFIRACSLKLTLKLF